MITTVVIRSSFCFFCFDQILFFTSKKWLRVSYLFGSVFPIQNCRTKKSGVEDHNEKKSEVTDYTLKKRGKKQQNKSYYRV